MRTIDQFLYGVVQAQRDEDYEEAKGDGDRSSVGKSALSQGRGETSFSEVTADRTPDSIFDEPLRSNFQVDEITVLPNAYIPIVMNSKFEFVPYESRLKEEANPMVARIDINKLTQV